jgi:hypothetical protein
MQPAGTGSNPATPESRGTRIMVLWSSHAIRPPSAGYGWAGDQRRTLKAHCCIMVSNRARC